MDTYAVLGATGNCGTALIEILQRRPTAKIHAYCRNKAKLVRLLPDIESSGQVRIFEGSIYDEQLLSACVRDCHAIFLVASTNDNIPGCCVAEHLAASLIRVLERLRPPAAAVTADTKLLLPSPRLIVLSSATLDHTLSQATPYLLRRILHLSASHVYRDLIRAEALLRAEARWLTSVFVKPGALAVDAQRGHALSLARADNPVSYLDLAAAMVDAADDAEGRWDLRNVGVVNTGGAARFPGGTPLCIVLGLVRHFFPFLHPYLPWANPR